MVLQTYDYLIIQINRFSGKLKNLTRDFKSDSDWNNKHKSDLTYVCFKDKNDLFITNPEAGDDVENFSPYIGYHSGFIILKGTITQKNFFELLFYLREEGNYLLTYSNRVKHLTTYNLKGKKVFRVCYNSDYKVPISMKRVSFYKTYDYLIIVRKDDPIRLEDTGCIREFRKLDNFCGLKCTKAVAFLDSRVYENLTYFFSKDKYKLQIAFEGPMIIRDAFSMNTDTAIMLSRYNNPSLCYTKSFKEVKVGNKLFLVIKH